MNPADVDLLVCPETREPLTLEIQQANSAGMVIEGTLHGREGRCYPIVRGVPRFLSQEQYSGSFGFEWNRWPRVQFESDNVGKPMQGHTTRMWETITGVDSSDVRDKTIVEFGCGSGRFLDVVRQKGGRAVGIDMSMAVEAARKNFADDPNVLIVQGDVLNPPFRTAAFDGGYSIGVLHHTPDPASGLSALTNAVRANGWVSVCVYPKGEFYDFRSVARMRKWHAQLSPRFGYSPALWYSLAAAYLGCPANRWLRKIPGLRQLLRYGEKNWFVMLNIPDARWRVLDIFDAITPAIATTHTADEVVQWLKAAGCDNLQPTPWCPTSFKARCTVRGAIQHAA